jgi:hypothetical protein
LQENNMAYFTKLIVHSKAASSLLEKWFDKLKANLGSIKCEHRKALGCFPGSGAKVHSTTKRHP